MEIKKNLKKYLSINNIDRKKAKFSKGSSYQFCYDPELIIIKNLNGQILFNKFAEKLKDLDTFRESGIEYIEDNVDFPYYILQMDLIECGIRYGLWDYYGNNISKLSKEILMEELQDDYFNFKYDIKRLLGIWT